MIAGSHRGLSFDAMSRMQLGQIVDYCVEYDNQGAKAEKKEKGKSYRYATQDEINAFFD